MFRLTTSLAKSSLSPTTHTHSLSNTAPYGSYNTDPDGMPCAWCSCTHRDIRKWLPDSLWNIERLNNEGAFFPSLPPVRRWPDFPLHGSKIVTNAVWKGFLELVADTKGARTRNMLKTVVEGHIGELTAEGVSFFSTFRNFLCPSPQTEEFRLGRKSSV